MRTTTLGRLAVDTIRTTRRGAVERALA